jgi:hypothetical protein
VSFSSQLMKRFYLNPVHLWFLTTLVAPGILRGAAAPDFVWAVQSTGTDRVKAETIGTAAVADNAGNVFVAGLVTGPSSFGTNVVGADGKVPTIFLCKYTTDGQVKWVKTFGSGNHVQCNALTLDGSGGVYLAGAAPLAYHSPSPAMVLLKYDADGHLLWTNSAGTSWSGFFTGPAASATGSGVAVDGAGNVYVAGSFTGQPAFASTNFVFSGVNFGHAGGGTFVTNSMGTSNGRPNDLFLAKYDSQGAFQWVRSAGGTNDDFAFGVSANPDGSVWLTGSFQGYATLANMVLTSTNEFIGDEAFVAKYDGTGQSLLVVPSSGSSDYKSGYAVCADKLGGAYVAGRMSAGFMRFGTFQLDNIEHDASFAPYSDTFLARLNGTGTVAWIRLIDRQTGGFGKDKSAVGLVLDNSGAPVLTGSYNDKPMFDSFQLPPPPTGSLYVAKYDPAGAFQWATSAYALRVSGQEWAGGGDTYFMGNNLAADGSGNLYLTGAFRSTDGSATFGSFSLTSHTDQFDVADYDFFLTKLGTGGNPPAGSRIGGLTILPGGMIQLQVSDSSPTVVIERSADLRGWETVSTNSVVNGTVTFSDSTVGNTSAQFYRISTAL